VNLDPPFDVCNYDDIINLKSGNPKNDSDAMSRVLGIGSNRYSQENRHNRGLAYKPIASN